MANEVDAALDVLRKIAASEEVTARIFDRRRGLGG
jgi:hypothetical protein